jgi:mersacidin/lichenicidin family type 2 lantibiotic
MKNDIRAWKDPLYRAELLASGETVFHPAGLVELKDEDLKEASGSVVGTTAPECTFYTFHNWRSCCPK